MKVQELTLKNLIPLIFYNLADILETLEFKKQMTFYTISVKEEFIEVRFYKYINKDVLSYQTVFTSWTIELTRGYLRDILKWELDRALRKFMKGK